MARGLKHARRGDAKRWGKEMGVDNESQNKKLLCLHSCRPKAKQLVSICRLLYHNEFVKE